MCIRPLLCTFSTTLRTGNIVAQALLRQAAPSGLRDEVVSTVDPRTRGVALAIQCGGESRRMGGDKALLPFTGGTLLEYVRDRVTPLFEHVFIVARDASRYGHVGLPVVTDALQTRGSAVGVYTAIAASPEERVLCLACDIPFVPDEVLLALAAGSPGYDVLVPRHGSYMQTVCAVSSRSAATPYYDFLAAGRRRIDALYPDCLLYTSPSPRDRTRSRMPS